VYSVALNWGEQRVDAGTAALVVNIGPVLIALLSGWLLGEGFPGRLMAGVALVSAGSGVAGLAGLGRGQGAAARRAALPARRRRLRHRGPAPEARSRTRAALGMVHLGVFPTALAFYTWAYALARTTAGKMGATTYLVPVVVVLMSWLFLGEVPTPSALAGGALCLVGVAVSRRTARTERTSAQKDASPAGGKNP